MIGRHLGGVARHPPWTGAGEAVAVVGAGAPEAEVIVGRGLHHSENDLDLLQDAVEEEAEEEVVEEDLPVGAAHEVDRPLVV